MRFKNLIFSTVFSLGALSVGAEPTATLTLTEARQIAQSALLSGNPALTQQLANGLLTANPKDAHALLLLSAAEAELKNPTAARQAAAKAYRAGDTKSQKLQAAQLAAQFALKEERPTLSQIWLRRASLQTQTEEQSEIISRAYRRVKSVNPWSVNLGFSVRPSDNVNNGADKAIQVIDGSPLVGFLSRDAQALSGTIVSGDVRASYRLHATERTRTTVSGRLYVQRVFISDETDALENDDFDATYGEISLGHMFALGDRAGDLAQFRLTRGTYWSADDTNYHLLRLDADRTWAVTPKTSLTLGASVAQYSRPGDDLQDSESYILRGRVSHGLENGDRIGFGLTYQQSDSDAVNRRSDQISARLTYGFSKSWGPAKASASLQITDADYPDYELGFFAVPGGRNDLSAYADLSLFFEDYDYAGFAPTVTFRAGRATSNVGRFETSEFSVNFGFQSKF
ncbi:MAG: surface lipoprotein assembly modifier [Paracoccaceae bacterium]